jgi:hypothetical protein
VDSRADIDIVATKITDALTGNPIPIVQPVFSHLELKYTVYEREPGHRKMDRQIHLDFQG